MGLAYYFVMQIYGKVFDLINFKLSTMWSTEHLVLLAWRERNKRQTDGESRVGDRVENVCSPSTGKASHGCTVELTRAQRGISHFYSTTWVFGLPRYYLYRPSRKQVET